MSSDQVLKFQTLVTKLIQNFETVNTEQGLNIDFNPGTTKREPSKPKSIDSFSSPLDNNAIPAANVDIQELRKTLNSLRRTSAEILPSFRIKNCGWAVQSYEQPVRVVNTKEKKAFYHGLQTCGSQWVCPVCAMKLQRKKADTVYDFLKTCQDDGISIDFITLTIPHTKQDDLQKLSNEIIETFRDITASRKFKRWKKKYHALGFIKKIDINFNLVNGWHPHFHIVLLFDHEKCKPWYRVIMGEKIIQLWMELLEEKGYKPDRRAQNWETCTSKRGLSDYIGKWDITKELTKGLSKTGAGLNPLQILERIQETKDPYLIEKWKEFARVTKGRQLISCSKNVQKELKRLYVYIDDDQAAVRDIEIDSVLGEITYGLWMKIRDKEERFYILNIAETYPDSTQDYIDYLECENNTYKESIDNQEKIRKERAEINQIFEEMRQIIDRHKVIPKKIEHSRDYILRTNTFRKLNPEFFPDKKLIRGYCNFPN
ncbi:hypothetical protein ES705_27675 [subsurface metagenome]